MGEYLGPVDSIAPVAPIRFPVAPHLSLLLPSRPPLASRLSHCCLQTVTEGHT